MERIDYQRWTGAIEPRRHRTDPDDNMLKYLSILLFLCLAAATSVALSSGELWEIWHDGTEVGTKP